MPISNGISIKDAISKLRVDLQEAAKSAEGEAFLFKVDDIELELSLAVERTGSTNGEINWWVVKAGAEVTQSGTATHKVKLKLSAGNLLVGDYQKTK